MPAPVTVFVEGDLKPLEAQTPYHAALLLLELCGVDELRALQMTDLRPIQGRVYAAEQMIRAAMKVAPVEPAVALGEPG